MRLAAPNVPGVVVNRSATRSCAAALLAVALATACAPDDDDDGEAGTSPSPSASGSESASETADPCAKESLQTTDAGQADHRHRQAGLRAVVRRRHPGERQGLRGRGRQGGLRADGLHRRRGHLDAGRVQQRLQADAEELGLRHQRVLDQREARAGRRLLLAVLRRQPGGRDHQGLQGRRRHDDRRPQGPHPRRAGRHHQPGRDQRGHRPQQASRGSTTPTTTR